MVMVHKHRAGEDGWLEHQRGLFQRGQKSQRKLTPTTCTKNNIGMERTIAMILLHLPDIFMFHMISNAKVISKLPRID